MTKVITPDTIERFAREVARPRDNLYYGYGEAFSANNIKQSTDCSGLVMSGGAWFQGMKWDRRYGSTESFRLDYDIVYELGFVRGEGGPEHFFKVGAFHGGGGPNSHIACTIAGVNWESSGSYGVQYGAPARGWNHPMFDDHWHWDGIIEPEFLASLTPEQERIVLGAAVQMLMPQTNAVA